MCCLFEQRDGKIRGWCIQPTVELMVLRVRSMVGDKYAKIADLISRKITEYRKSGQYDLGNGFTLLVDA